MSSSENSSAPALDWDPLTDLSPEQLARLRRLDLLLPLVRRSLVAATLQRVEIPQELSQQLMQRYMQQQGIRDKEALHQHLLQRGFSMRDLRWTVELQARINRYSREHFSAKAEAHFLSRKSQLDRITYSLIRVQDQFLARELYLQAVEGEADFGQLAEQYAEGPERSSRGVVGPVPANQGHPVLMGKLRTAEPGQVLEPLQLADWWVVARLEQSMPASFDEAMAQRMAVELFHRWIAEQAADRLKGLSVAEAEDRTP